ncbi:single-stranded DNA-binding protein [Vibrio sp. PID23_8]|uniref:single-stranded DNA-binding protein n=1 Tax=Vibrio sp. PID23_8 TaxID=1583767 RepID=UPI000E687D00|nr:single-stranded DNA-binding protein [Vibrio sp. PID23_8]RIZ55155.1 single-stranded DNA-binding protein [Vibrio sp. PID23_8]
MPTCVMPNAQGFLAVVADMSQTACDGGFVAITAAEYDYMMSYTQITSIEATSYFSGGFAAVFVAGFASTYAIKIALKLVNIL